MPLTPCNNGSIIAREARAGRIRSCRSPKVVCRIGEEIDLRLVEEGCFPAIALSEDDFVEEFDSRIISPRALPLMEELVESLSLLQHCDILHILMWHTLHKLVHLEMVHHARSSLITCGRDQVPPICVQQARETSHKGCSNLVRAERRRAHEADAADAPAVRIRTAAYVVLDER